jgi:hypothetical protein
VETPEAIVQTQKLKNRAGVGTTVSSLQVAWSK